MVHIHTERVVAAPRQFVFDYMGDFRNAADWIFGITELVAVGDTTLGLGTVYDGSMKVGPKTLHSIVKVTRWEPPTLFEHEHISGFVVDSTWRVNALECAESEVVVDIDYEMPGGIAGRVLGRIIGPFLSVAIDRSQDTLRNRLEKDYQAAASAS